MNDVLKIGLIGLGKMGLTRAREIARHPQAQVTVGADPNISTHKDYPEVECFTDIGKVIDSDVDAVFVATPNR
ncbi:MAG: Gfo/Idh/MocA family oxidoreductase, partial [Candidatus Omnitrophica bacterium]|nr:Gfo/Idh/MocA family oxidoreductase [Candidatus Omnitrophota bacterium]